ncbi:MAG: phosphotransferase [Bacteroidetes bacterium]|nr:phosphotransferase [Bacteroidota bacterium]
MIHQQLALLFEDWAKEKAVSIDLLPASGSYRKYFRIVGVTKTCLGVYNADKKENQAFIAFTKHFLQKKCNVPNIFAENLTENIYLIEDFGDETLFNRIQKLQRTEENNEIIIELYKKVIDELPKFQIIAAKDFDFTACYPRAEFDKQSMFWDLNYFKYYFLKLAQIPFDEQKLEEDFHVFTDFLLEAENNYFLYRDFQSRNIMLYQGKPYFVDYQGGRRGALQYDIASLLYDAKADLSNEVRAILLEYYIERLQQYIQFDKQKFSAYYYGFVMIRIMQAMGAYGFRGFYENKTVFLQSIPYALNNLNWILKNTSLPISIPTLTATLSNLSQATKIKKIVNTQNLKININSFSYKQQIPIDNTGNGGGFVFDCRALPNPGRIEVFRTQTGKDKTVINFLESEIVVKLFLDNVFNTICISIDNYIERGFENLMINFGCTGGQHRSVYCAEKIAAMISERYNLHCNIQHTAQKDNN